MKIDDQTPIAALKILIGKKGTVRFAGKESKCTVEEIILDDEGIKLALRDAYNRKVKRSPFKFEPDEG